MSFAWSMRQIPSALRFWSASTTFDRYQHHCYGFAFPTWILQLSNSTWGKCINLSCDFCVAVSMPWQFGMHRWNSATQMALPICGHNCYTWIGWPNCRDCKTCHRRIIEAMKAQSGCACLARLWASGCTIARTCKWRIQQIKYSGCRLPH